MIDKRVGFIGAGNMGEAIIRGLVKSGLIKSKSIIASDCLQDRLGYLKTTYDIETISNNKKLIQDSDIIILAIKPQITKEVLNEIQSYVSEHKLIISIAAGISLAQIKKILPKKSRIIRCMPNTPALVLKGMSVICQDNKLKEDVLMAKRLFESVGNVLILDEKCMDIVTAISGSGPAYYFLILDSIADAGVKMGLPKSTALLLAAETMLGSASLLIEFNKHPAELKDMVTSPAGTTSHGLHVLEEIGLKGAFISAIEAAYNRSCELSHLKG